MSDAPERIAIKWVEGAAITSGPLMQHSDYTHYVRADRIDELEDDLQHQTSLIEQLFALLEIKEQKDDGRYFHPNIIRSSRALDAEKLETIMAELKRTVTANSKSNG